MTKTKPTVEFRAFTASDMHSNVKHAVLFTTAVVGITAIWIGANTVPIIQNAGHDISLSPNQSPMFINELGTVIVDRQKYDFVRNTVTPLSAFHVPQGAPIDFSAFDPQLLKTIAQQANTNLKNYLATNPNAPNLLIGSGKFFQDLDFTPKATLNVPALD